MATIIANRKRLISAINAASKAAASKRCPKPILRSCKLSVNGHVTFSATDIEVESAIDVDCEHHGDAELLFDPKALLARLRMSKAKECKVVVDPRDKWLSVDESEASECIATDNANEHPYMLNGSYKPKYGIIVDAADVKHRIGYVADCVDTECTRYALGGILFEIHHDAIILVATDGRRMAWTPIGSRRTNESPEVSGILPVVSIKSLVAMLGEVSRVAISIDHDGTRIVFEGLDDDDNITAHTCSRLVEGRFPNWVDVAEGSTADIPHSVTLNAVDVANAAKLAKNANKEASSKDETYSGVELQFNDTGTVSWVTAGRPSCRGKIDCVSLTCSNDGCDCRHDRYYIAMNVDASYLESAAIKQKRGDLTFSMKDENSALVIHHSDWCELIMPMSRE